MILRNQSLFQRVSLYKPFETMKRIVDFLISFERTFYNIGAAAEKAHKQAEEAECTFTRVRKALPN